MLFHGRIGTVYSLLVHIFERFFKANIADMLRLGGMLPLNEAADPRRLLCCASDPDPLRP